MLSVIGKLKLVCKISENIFSICLLSSYVVLCNAKVYFYAVKVIHLFFKAPGFRVSVGTAFLNVRLKRNSPKFSSSTSMVSFFFLILKCLIYLEFILF